MKLSEDLEQCHASGEFGQALEGYAEKAKLLEDMVWSRWVQEAANRGASITAANEYANDRMEKLFDETK